MNEKRTLGVSASLAFLFAGLLVLLNLGIYLKFGKLNFFFASLVFLIMLIFFEIYAFLKTKSKEQKIDYRILCLGIFIALSVAELVVRKTKVESSYYERIGRKWESPYKQPEAEREWFHYWTPNSEIQDKTNEFNYAKKSNSLGIVDLEHSKEKKENEFRILGLGDSFTEGIGSPWLCNWPYYLDTLLENHNLNDATSFYVINGGVAGSDVYFGKMMLQEKFIDYQPDLVISAVNFSDVTDVILRGGDKRFLADTIMAYNTAPWYEPLYGSSHVFRLLMSAVNKDDFYMTKKQRKLAEEAAKDSIASAVLETAIFCEKKSINYVAVFHPFDWEIEQEIFSFQKQIDFLEKQNIQTIDLFESYSSIPHDELKSLYWPIDHHHNQEGYYFMANKIYEELINQNLLDEVFE